MSANKQQRKGKWTPNEDDLLRRLVTEYGEDVDWTVLERNFNGMRDSKQIRERWINHLNPSIKKRKFNDEEIKIIEDEFSKHKFKWVKISKKIPNTTPLMIKNFYNNRLKKKNLANKKKQCNASTTTNTTIPTIDINNFNNTTANLNNFYDIYDGEYLPINLFKLD